MRGGLPVLIGPQREGLRAELRDVIEYRKSGLSLNHVIGCPLDCVLAGAAGSPEQLFALASLPGLTPVAEQGGLW